jgi:hypothetical protein
MTKTKDIMTYGRTAYEKYAAVSDGKSLISGEPLPDWNELKPSIQRAWNAAGNAVADSLLDDVLAPPELAAALTETRQLRARLAMLGDILHEGGQSDESVRRRALAAIGEDR